MALISIKDLWFRYQAATDWTLQGINLEIDKGEFVAIMGRTGAGKSTLCLTLNGIVPHSIIGSFKGSVSIDGVDTRGAAIPQLAKTVGMTFQDLESQLFGLTVEEEIAFGPENLGLSPSDIGERIDEALDVVRMKEYRFRSPWELSGGQKQRVAIAAALALRPRVLVMDEPTSELDPVGKREIFSVIEALRDRHGITTILVEHEAEQIAKYADRVVMMENGRVDRDEAPRQFFSEVLKQGTRRIRCPQVSDMADRLRRAGMWQGEIPITLEEGSKIVQEILSNSSRSRHLQFPLEDNPPTSPAIIQVRDLHYSYPSGPKALTGITLDIYKGQIIAIIGQNGSGKTTLVKHFNGLLKSSSGSVSVGGVDTKNKTVAELSRTVGYAFQNPDHQIFCETVEEELSYGPRNLGLSEDMVKAVVGEVLDLMDLSTLRSEHPMSLGKGERKLVAVSSVVTMNPEVLILDEPTTGQDFANTKRISEAIKRIHAQGKTVILVTHDMGLVAALAKRTVVLSQGEVLLDVPTRVAFGQPETLSKSFIEPPQIVALSNALKGSGFPTCLDVNEMCEELGTNAVLRTPTRLT